MNSSSKRNKAFTLIELLVVIAILAVLAVAVTLILNPAELIRQGRDSTRLSDLATINRALGLYQTDQIARWMGTSTIVYTSLPDTTSTCASYGLPSLPSGWEYHCVQSSSSTKVNGSGWIPVDFTSMSFSSPLSRLPLDPVNEATSSKYYTYISGGSWELSALMEASSNKLGGDNDRVSNDGGDSYSFYEVGDDLNLSPLNDDGLVGYWQFDEGTGSTTADLSGNGGTGTLIDGLTWTTSAKVGDYALDFDGVNGYVAVSSTLSNTSGDITTFSLWVKLESYDAFGCVLFATNTGTTVYWQIVEDDDIFLAGNRFSVTATDLDDNTWHHITFVSDGTNSIFYADGTEKGSNTNAVVSLSAGPKDFGIGDWIGDPGTNWTVNGLMDDVRIYNRALSAAEIEAMYNSY